MFVSSFASSDLLEYGVLLHKNLYFAIQIPKIMLLSKCIKSPKTFFTFINFEASHDLLCYIAQVVRVCCRVALESAH